MKNLKLLSLLLAIVFLGFLLGMLIGGEFEFKPFGDTCRVGEEFYSRGAFHDGVFLYMEVPEESVGWYPTLPVLFTEQNLPIGANFFAQEFKTVECARMYYGQFADRGIVWDGRS